MPSKTFKALVVEEIEKGKFTRAIQERFIEDLPDGEVLIKVRYSSLNYKDALSATGNKGVTREYPHTPGIDSAGVVEESDAPKFAPGDKVIVHGYDLGMNTSGGFAQYIRVPTDWVVRLRENLSLKESMMYGTAGFTAAMSVKKLLDHGTVTNDGEILVTGATGGVGSFAVALLALEGFSVVAATGKTEQANYLKSLGASKVISRDEVNDDSGKPLLTRRWAGVVDTVGGVPLSTAIRSTDYEGTVTTCGNAAGAHLDLTVYPFILRGVSLLGVDSANYPMKIRQPLWEKIATDWKLEMLDEMTRECSLADISGEIDRILDGKQVGRVVVDLWD
ncbi:MAG: YhdH/YhfP family quinone oxidoreductase [Candidatus Marinimicrobia bacterium]|nr:YhdH/YhfP family quinone oxidoreductase [Candidatus Neomarinimicrobiota bacterium]MCF7827828.1 YhdH/YhfP family quinone oxidoreductase [Candidatus Neomarinimicrobiota bacterium]MCF7879417.1 YhdH/YhfP family quinone oxidoreductase [Candidatus Neomarinimicrobiota bacterium]